MAAPSTSDDANVQDMSATRFERPSAPERRGAGAPELPEDLLRAAAKRLRLVALIYAGGFLLVESSVALLDPVQRQDYTHFYGWAPGTVSIVLALVVAALAGGSRLSLQSIMNVGVAFEVVAAYAIAAATYWGVYRGLEYEPRHLAIFGLSFVAPWIMFYTIVIPNPPRKALWAATLAATAVPVALLLTMRYGGTSITLTVGTFVSTVIVPYGIIVVTAYIGAQVVYRLGRAVQQAREMGSYRLIERLSSGGMGEVWRADHRMLARPAAVKFVRQDVLGGIGAEKRQRTLGRFKREARATALMRSPHTIELYDFGVTDDGTFYYVMELLDGFDLETLVQRFGPLPAERAIHLLRQACDSLAEAHASALIHRDIKPANIYVCRFGGTVDFVKVLDFGLVKGRQADALFDADVTGEHMAGGTPPYMAPEQAGGAEDIDARADIYAVGCVAYWLLTGKLVFEGRTAVELMAHHIQTAPVAPSERTESEIPTALDEVILACLEKDPDRRPQSARDLSQLLAACDTAAPWTEQRAQEWWQQHRPFVPASMT
jgi:serine/threonine-protein kinase